MRATLGLAFAAIVVAPVVGASAAGEEGNFAYDQFTAMAIGSIGQLSALGQSPSSFPSPGSFSAFRALVRDDLKDTNYPPPYGDVVPGIDNISRLFHGVLLRKSTFGKLTRVDDPISHRATILRPDKGIVIYLDRDASTYSELSGDAAAAILKPPSPVLPTDGSLAFATPAPAEASSPAPAATGDSETIVMSSQTKSIDGLIIDGVATHGLSTTFTATAENVTGSCLKISTTSTMTIYVDPNRIEPSKTTALNATAASMLKSLPQLKCHVRVQPPATTAPMPDEKAFVLYQRLETSTTVPSLATPLTSTFVTVRGNVTELDGKDPTLFDIPAGFKELPLTPVGTAATASEPPGR